VDEIVEEYKDTLSSPTRVSIHYQVNNSIDMTLSDPLSNGHVYSYYGMDNE
jgi:hypothetical protein